MSLKERMRKFVLPTWQEQQERMAREEAKRRANYARQQAILDHQLASLGRQETLAEKREKITRLKKKLHPQPTRPTTFSSTEAIGDALGFTPFEKERRRKR